MGAILLAVRFLKEGLAAALQGKKLRLIQPIALDGRLVAAPIEGTMTLRHGSEEAVEKVKADAEVSIHEAFAVQTFVMNIVKFARFQKPIPQARDSGHPEILDVHPVVQIAEHQDRPAEERGKREHLVRMRDMKKSHHAPAHREKHCRR